MSKWSRIDVSNIDDKEIESNLSVYRETKELKSDAMSDYVDAAMSSGNHLAFAQEFIDAFIKRDEYGLPYNELMSLAGRKVDEYLSWKAAETSPHKRSLSRERKKTVEMHSKLQASYYMKDTAWRSPSCVYPDKSEANCKSEAKTGEPKQVSGRKVLYSADGRKNWKSGTRIKRDVLVQHALVMGLNADETDDLLMRAGYPALYPLDAVDACAIINLNEYAGRLDISPYEVLWKVKNDINHILQDLDGSGIVFVEKGTADGAWQGVLTSAAGRYIDKELQELRKVFEKQKKVPELPAGCGLTKFLTKYYSERIENAHDAAAYFHDSGVDANVIFTQRYYGFLKKTKEYLYDWKRYRKNLLSCTWKLTAAFADHDFHSDRRFRPERAVYDSSVQTILKNLANAEADSEQYYEDCLRLLQYVRSFDVLDQPGGLISLNSYKKDKFTYGRIMLEGEEKKFKRADFDTFETGTTTITGYVFEMKKKHDVVRFALSAGREEELGDYLVLARYWKRNWYREISGGKSLAACREEGFYPDLIDKLVIYALLYRDKLIENWCNKKANATVLRDQILEVFPMRELILEISYDISFVYMYGIKHIHKTKIKDPAALDEIYTEFENLRQNMIFPVQWKGRKGKMITYDRDCTSYKNNKKYSGEENKKSAPRKEDIER